MKTRRNVLLLVNVLILPLVLFHFQNCSSAGGGAQASSASDSGGNVSISQLNGQTQISFVQNSVQIKDNVSSTGVDGFCGSQVDGAQLKWTVWGGQDSSTPVATGSAVCNNGSFSVAVVGIEQFTCGVSQLLTVEGDWGGSTFTHITRLCQPLSSVAIATPADLPAGTSCDLEYSAASIAEHACAQVCYSDNKVVSMTDVDASQCSSLAANLSASSN